MTTRSTLESLDIDDRILLRLQILFEEHTIILNIEDENNENTLYCLTFGSVHAFFTNTPTLLAFPQARIVALQWQQLPDNRFRAELFLDIRFSATVLIFTIVFESLHIQPVDTLHSPTLLL